MAVTLLALGLAMPVHAAADGEQSVAVAVWPAEGNRVCRDYAANDVIHSIDTTKVVDDSGQPGLSGPENPADADATGETISYSVNSINGAAVEITEFQSSTPLDFVIIKSGRDINVFVYDGNGVFNDVNIAFDDYRPITALSFCYGISSGAIQPPPPPTSLPNCGDIDGLDKTFVSCPEDGSRAFVCNFEPDKDFFGLDDDNCCFCNHENTSSCDPELPVGSEGACPKPGKDLIEVPSSVEAVKNPGTFYCITVGGRRVCYSD